MNKVFRRFLSDSEGLFDEPKTEKSVRIIASLIALIALLGASIGIPFTADVLYFGALIAALVFLLYKGGFKISMPFLVLYFVILLNVTVLDIPEFFKPFQRGVLFILLTLVCSSSLDTNVSVKFRGYLFRYTVFGVMIIAVGSFFCFFAGINLMKSPWSDLNDFDTYATNGGWFSGLASHSMILGPIAMISSLSFYFMYQKRSSNWYLLLFFVSAMSAVMAASRSSILGLMIAIVYNLIAGKVNSTLRKRMIKILVVSAIITIPIAGVAFKGLINKQENRNEQSEGLNSRQGKFDARIDEFKSSPIFGIGFSAVDFSSGDADITTGRVEPGTSHLAVLSMLGFLGFSVYLMILYKGYANTRRINTLHSRFVFSCFIAFFVHAWFEGYVLAAGGFMAYLYWLVLGQSIDCTKAFRLKGKVKQKVALSKNNIER